MDFKNTVFLPQTAFSMKAGLAQKEPDILSFWQSIDLYGRLRKKSKGKEKFILHYGPPYANGNIHIGHALSEVLKDIVVKTKQMQGYDAPLVPGWDCHGLPIEWKVEENFKAKGMKKEDIHPLDMIKACRDFAKHWIDVQAQEFIRLGITGNFKKPYITMNSETEGKIVAEISKFLMNGALYRGLKPVLWSVVEKTALADAEMEYKDHTSDSIYVRFKITHPSRPLLDGAYAVIWTTTPWTLPGNRAIAYGKDFDYSVIQVADKKLLISKDLLNDFIKILGGQPVEFLGCIHGKDLKGTICAHPWRGQGYDFDVPLIEGSHVTVETGTGLVHTAPGHGQEDFDVAKEFGIPVPETVADDGTYYDHVPLFAGLHIFKANTVVIDALKDADALIYHTKLVHSYPHSWRSKAPLIYRATPQWFINIDESGIRQKALAEIERVSFYPDQGRNRIQSMVENRPDWCVSRQRVWGVPIAIFVDKKTNTPLRDQAVQDRIIEAISKEGVEAWRKCNPQDFLGDQYNADDYVQVKDIVDVWFESGATHAYVLEEWDELRWPADLYLEGSDQHRGWFQSSLLESCGTKGRAPFEAILTHGFTLDEKGHKMSKSVGNVVAPQDIINKLGADILRLWIVNSDYTQDLRIGNDILKQQEDIYRRFRNTLRYLLGAISGFDASEHVEYDQMPTLEQWVLHRLYELEALHTACVEKYDLMAFYSQLHTFCSQDLSAFYFDLRKDSLYCDHASDTKRRAARTVMHLIFNTLVRYLAPVLSFTAEEAWLCYKGNKESSIHEELFLKADLQWHQPELGEKYKKLRHMRRVMTTALEQERNAKTIGSSLQAHIYVYATKEVGAFLDAFDLCEIAITSNATIVIATPPANALTLDEVNDLGVVVLPAEGQKCQRCWKISHEVGDESRKHKDVCIRCEDVVKRGE